MPSITYPNQRMVCVHRERASSDFLGIKNENWQAAARDLGAHSLMLYLYLASNANNYTVALSPVAVRQAVGMARSTYHDQFHRLVDKGYLVPAAGNTYNFYERPQPAAHTMSLSSVGAQEQSTNPNSDGNIEQPDSVVLQENIEINNSTTMKKNTVINNSNLNKAEAAIPKVKEIIISVPRAEGKARPQPREEIKKASFVF